MMLQALQYKGHELTYTVPRGVLDIMQVICSRICHLM